MAKEPDNEYTIDELLDMEVMTRNEARIYIQNQLGINRNIYYKNIYPQIIENFTPLIVNKKERRAHRVVISKDKLDEVIADCKKRVADKSNKNSENRS